MPSSGRGLCFPLVKACVFGNEPKASDEVPLAPRTEPAETTPTWQALKLFFCAVGLQVGRAGRQDLLLFLAWLPWAGSVDHSFHLTSPNRVLVGVLRVPLLPEAHSTTILEVVEGNVFFPLFCDLYCAYYYISPLQ